MQTTIIFLIITTLISSSLLTIWFGTPSAPGLLFHVLRKLNFKKNDKEFWMYPDPNIQELDGNQLPLYDWTEDDWQMFATRLGFLGSLLTCRFCLGTHVIIWVNIISFILCLLFGIFTISSCYIILLGILIEPVLVQILVKHAIQH